MKNKDIITPNIIKVHDKKYIEISDQTVLDKIKWIELNPTEFSESEIQEMLKQTSQSYKYEPDSKVPQNNSISVRDDANVEIRKDRQNIMTNLYKWYKMPKINTLDDIAVQSRIENYIEISAEQGDLISLEKLSLSLGVTTATLRRWKNGDGCSRARSNLINQMYELIHAFETELAFTGKIDKTMYIFRSKNHYDMVDKKDIVITDGNVLGEKIDLDTLSAEISEHYEKD